MSEFDPNPYRDDYATAESKQARAPGIFSMMAKGCLVAVFSFFIVSGLILAVIVGLVFAKSMKQDASIMTFKPGADGVRERVIDDGTGTKKIAVINIQGIIYPGDGVSRTNSPAESIIQQVKKAQEDASVVAVVLDMNTPGGAVTATDEIHHELMKLRTQGKPIVTCMRTVAASGGYYLAAASNYIIANRLTLTGSIGVILGGYNYHGLIERFGIQSEVYKSGKFKDILNMGRPRQEDEAKVIQALVDETYLEFAQIVATGRGMELEKVTTGSIGDGSIFSGRKAQELGLVDGLGFFEDALAKAKELANAPDADVVRYYSTHSFADFFLSLQTNVLSELLPGHPGVVTPGTPYYLCPLAL